MTEILKTNMADFIKLFVSSPRYSNSSCAHKNLVLSPGRRADHHYQELVPGRASGQWILVTLNDDKHQIVNSTCVKPNANVQAKHQAHAFCEIPRNARVVVQVDAKKKARSVIALLCATPCAQLYAIWYLFF